MLDELYLGDFGGFVARRNELAKRLTGEGDRDGAKRVRALAKPSRVAWAVNQFSDRRARLREELLEAGAALRDAQAGLVSGKGDRAALKEARARERKAVGKAITAIGKLVEADGASLGSGLEERARQTLHAVALDDDVRRDFEACRLETDRDATGLGELPTAAAPPKPPDHEERRRERAELQEAKAGARRAEHDRLEAEQALEAARHAAEKAQTRLNRAAESLQRANTAASEATARVEAL